MKKLKVGQQVTDTWFKEYGIGVCVKALKTVFHIKFHDEIRVYDKPHLQFLKIK